MAAAWMRLCPRVPRDSEAMKHSECRSLNVRDAFVARYARHFNNRHQREPRHPPIRICSKYHNEGGKMNRKKNRKRGPKSRMPHIGPIRTTNYPDKESCPKA